MSIRPHINHDSAESVLLLLFDTIATARKTRGMEEKVRFWRPKIESIAEMNALALKVQSLWRRRISNS